MSESRATHGIRAAAARAAHEALGLQPLRPERVWPEHGFRPGTPVRLEAGAVACVLAPVDWYTRPEVLRVLARV